MREADSPVQELLVVVISVHACPNVQLGHLDHVCHSKGWIYRPYSNTNKTDTTTRLITTECHTALLHVTLFLVTRFLDTQTELFNSHMV